LAKLGVLPSLKALYESVSISEVVYGDVVVKGRQKEYTEVYFIEKTIEEKFLRVETLSKESRKLADELATFLGLGEAQSIALCLQERADVLLVDDERARRASGHLGVKWATTLDVLFALLLEGKLTMKKYEELITQHASQAWVEPELVREYLEKARAVRRTDPLNPGNGGD